MIVIIFHITPSIIVMNLVHGLPSASHQRSLFHYIDFHATQTVTHHPGPEHVSETELRDTPLNIPLCGRALRSVAHGQSITLR